jgi:hypothetical protein
LGAPEFVKEGRAALCRCGRRPASLEIGEKMGGYKKKAICVFLIPLVSVYRGLFILSSVKVAASSHSIPNKCCIVHDLHN